MAAHRSGLTRGLSTVRAHPSAVLLAVQLLGVVLYPFVGDNVQGRLAVSLFGLVALGLAVAAVRMTPALTRVSLLIGLPVIVLTVWEALDPSNTPVGVASNTLHAAFYFYTGYALLRYMFADHEVSRDELYATGACFTVFAWAFAYTYAAVQLLEPGAFLVGHGGRLTWMETLFLSFTTMTNTGLSDIVPIGNHARSIIMLEQLAGLNYMALVVARLLGLTLAHRPRSGA